MISLASGPLSVFGQPGDARDRISDQTAILHQIARISKAYAGRDALPFGEIYLPNFVSIKGKPVYNTRQQLIAMMEADGALLRAGKKLEFDTIAYESGNPRITFHGNSAIVNIAKKHYWQYRGQKCLTTMQATELWVRQEGVWKIAAGHVSTFQCDPKPYHPIHPAVAAIPSLTKAPANLDPDAEQQVRELVNRLAAARTSSPMELAAAIESVTSKEFTATDLDGEINSDRTLLTSLPVSTPGRSVGIRGQDEEILIFDTSAIYTFRVKTSGSAAPQQTTVFLAKARGRWLTVAAHTSRSSVD